jgi:hypothetical protein
MNDQISRFFDNFCESNDVMIIITTHDLHYRCFVRNEQETGKKYISIGR